MNEYYILIGNKIVPATRNEYNQWRDRITLDDVIIGKYEVAGFVITTLFTGIKNPHGHDIACTIVVEAGMAQIDAYHTSIDEARKYHTYLINNIHKIAAI